MTELENKTKQNYNNNKTKQKTTITITKRHVRKQNRVSKMAERAKALGKPNDFILMFRICVKVNREN